MTMEQARLNSVGLVQPKQFTFGSPPNELRLESGRTLGPVTISYEAYGTLNHSKSNVILITPGLTADCHAAGKHTNEDKYPGWWDGLIGPGKAFDTNTYYIISTSIIGSCVGSTGPASIYPITGKPYGMLFPVITVTDMVNAQKVLLDHLGITHLVAVSGGSLGGMQALEWGRLYPDYISSTIPVSCSDKLSPQGIAFNEIGRQTIMADPNWNEGHYYTKKIPRYGLAIARMIGHITYLSEEKLNQKFGRRTVDSRIIKSSIDNQFEVESYLHYKGNTFVERFDANAYIYVTRALDLFDLSRETESLEESCHSLPNQNLFLTMSTDWLFPPEDTLKLHEVLLSIDKKSEYHMIESIHGHDGFLLEVDQMTPYIKNFLKNIDS